RSECWGLDHLVGGSPHARQRTFAVTSESRRGRTAWRLQRDRGMQTKATLLLVSTALFALASTPGCGGGCVVGYPQSPITTSDTAGTVTLSAPASFQPPKSPLQIRYGSQCTAEAASPGTCTTGFKFSITTAEGQWPTTGDIDVDIDLPAKLTTGTL